MPVLAVCLGMVDADDCFETRRRATDSRQVREDCLNQPLVPWTGS